MVKNPPANADRCNRRRFDPWEDPLEEEMATHSSILAQRIPMDRGAWWATVHRVTKSQTQLKRLSTHVKMKSVGISSPSQAVLLTKLKPPSYNGRPLLVVPLSHAV